MHTNFNFMGSFKGLVTFTYSNMHSCTLICIKMGLQNQTKFVPGSGRTVCIHQGMISIIKSSVPLFFVPRLTWNSQDKQLMEKLEWHEKENWDEEEPQQPLDVPTGTFNFFHQIFKLLHFHLDTSFGVHFKKVCSIQNNADWRKINLHLLGLHKIWTTSLEKMGTTSATRDATSDECPKHGGAQLLQVSNI